jgi:hypothetical protein
MTRGKAALRVVLSIVVLFAVGLTAFYMRGSLGSLRWRPVPEYYTSLQRATPFPKTLPPAAFSDPTVARAYEIAKRIPEVLVQQPSYCAFVERHHESLLECFRTNDAARCKVCLQEAYLADKMNRSGKSAAEIRTSIIAGEWRSMKLE